MSDGDASSERPPYWAKCEKMTFLELYRYIDRASDRLSGAH